MTGMKGVVCIIQNEVNEPRKFRSWATKKKK
jgi:hypothetical protein